MTVQNTQNAKNGYRIGDGEIRPWGHYVVTAAGADGDGDGSEFCEKTITVEPGKILSLQSHSRRAEIWRVEDGELTVILDGKRTVLKTGEMIAIPLQSIHCMANLTARPCIVHERQTGVCREDDIVRYIDAYGRATQPGGAAESVALYREILEDIAQRVPAG